MTKGRAILNSKVKVLGIGSPILDILVNVDEAFISSAGGGKGGMALVDSKRQDELLSKIAAKPSLAIGGSAGNSIFGLAHLGVQTAFLGKLGEDQDGEFYMRSYAGLGGDVSRFKRTKAAHTGRCLSMITPDSERTMRTDLGAACMLSAEDVSAADFEGVTHVHAEGYLLYLPGILQKVLELAKQASCTVSLDLATFDVVKLNRKLLPELLDKYVDIVFANEDEAKEFCGASSFSPEAAAEALGAHCAVAAVKLGKEGCCIRRDGRNVRVGAELVKAVDTTGAGDLWQAGFLYAHLNGASPEACGACGAILGSEVVQVLGAAIPAERWPLIMKRLPKI